MPGRFATKNIQKACRVSYAVGVLFLAMGVGNGVFAAVPSKPSFFNTTEQMSTKLTAFKKWL